MRYTEKYLKPNSKIIEIGAVTGKYSIRWKFSEKSKMNKSVKNRYSELYGFLF